MQAFRDQALASCIHDGGVVACPAEAVWGLSCHPFSEPAVGHILELKQRPVSKRFDYRRSRPVDVGAGIGVITQRPIAAFE